MSTVVFNKDKLLRQLKDSNQRATSILRQEIVKSSNYFAPQDQGDLIKSAINSVASNPYANTVIWGVPYARYLYYGVTKNGKPINYSPDANPNARSRWYEHAKNVHLDNWIRVVNEEYKRSLGGGQ